MIWRGFFCPVNSIYANRVCDAMCDGRRKSLTEQGSLSARHIYGIGYLADHSYCAEENGAGSNQAAPFTFASISVLRER